MAKFFIRRPVLAIVLSIVIVLLGVLAMQALPIAQYPDVSPPTVTVNTLYLGASADVVEKSVATTIEKVVNGAPGMTYMQSRSGSDGSYSLVCTFRLGTDINIAAVDVQNRVQQAMSSLPAAVQSAGVTVTKKSLDTLVMISIFSPNDSFDALFLTNYTTINVMDPLSRSPGVGTASLFGAGPYAMRVWVRPDKLAKLGLMASDIMGAIQEQSVAAPAGSIGQPPAKQDFQYTVNVAGQLASKEQFDNIIVKTNPDGSILRVKDVARTELGAQSYSNFARVNGRPAAVIFISQSPGANALDTAAGVRKLMASLSKNFPPGMKYAINVDNTVFVNESIHDVEKTLYEAIGLVLIVVLVFLGNIRATIIPMLAVPVSLIGTFAAFGPLGFSINSLTLFGLVLAIGLVVDDAIVVVEAVEQHIEKGLSPREATEKAMSEVSGPVIAVALVLISVFIPVAFVPGVTGQLYQQFALTLSVSVAISAFVALTLTPALCTIILRPRGPATNVFSKAAERFNYYFGLATDRYAQVVRMCIRRTVMMLVLLGAIAIGAGGLIKFLPEGFVPYEDQGYMFAQVTLPDGASLDRTDAVAKKAEAYLRTVDGVQDVLTVGGYSILAGTANSNAVLLAITLKPWDERTKRNLQLFPLYRRLQDGLGNFPEAMTLVFPPPPLPGFAGTGFNFEIEDHTADGLEGLSKVANAFLAEAGKRPELSNLMNMTSDSVPQLKADVDRDKVKTLGIPLDDVFKSLQINLGGALVNDFILFGRSWKTMVQAEPEYSADRSGISKIFVRNASGAMVPLGTLVKVSSVLGPDQIQRFNAVLSTEISGTPANGSSSGQAIAAMEAVAKKTLPPGYSYEWSGLALEQVESAGQQGSIFLLALVLVFLVLAAQYENWGVPFSIVLGMPIAAFGALLSVGLRTVENNVYVQIGMIVLVGLAAKNAVLIVEFAKEAYERDGTPLVDAAVAGARQRLRPILMTSLAFIIGTIPLAFATGAGANARQSLGSAVSGGMTIATAVGIFFIPVLYVAIVRLEERLFKPAPRAPAAPADLPEPVVRV